MNILHILPFALFPQNAGNKVNSLKLINYQINCKHEVGIIYLEDRKQFISQARDFKFKEYTKLTGINNKPFTSLFYKIINRLGFIMNRFSFNPIFLLSNKDKNLIRNSLIRNNYEAVIVHYLVLSEILNILNSKSIKTIIFTHDLIFMRDRYIKIPKNIRRKKEEVEIKLLNLYDYVLVVSTSECKALLEKGFSRNNIILAGSSHEICDTRQGMKRFDILFVGAIGNQPNIDGIIWFIENIWKAYDEIRDNYSLAVAGSVCSALSKYTNCSNIHLLNYVDDLSHTYSCSKIVVVPLLSGSGVKIKLVEALAHAKPVISTSVGSDGLELVPGKDYVLANNPEEWRQKIISLLESNEIIKKYEDNSFEWAINNASDKSVWAELEQCLKS